MPALPSCILEPLWDQFAALLPPRTDSHPLGCHRRRIPDRVVFDKLIQVLVFGCGYRRIDDATCSATTLRRRRDEWIAQGLAERLHLLVLTAYDRMLGLQLDDLAVDGCITKAPCGGQVAGCSPVDRGKQGLKRSAATEAGGIPLAAVPAPANRHDSPLLAPTLAKVFAVLDQFGPRPTQPMVHLDAGYDSDKTRTTLAERHLAGQIAHKGVPAPIQATRRWPVERTHAWGNQFGKLRWCTERNTPGGGVLDVAGAGDHHVGSAAPPGLDLLPLARTPTAPTVTPTGQRGEDDACAAGSLLGRQPMFAGLDDVDWASMHHAYGPATDVPDLLRGLLADDAQAREMALDGLYGAVHHQGDIYDCTIACIPFLLQAVADARVLDRGGILGLLASIGGANIDDQDDTDIAEEDESSWHWNFRLAHQAVLAGNPTFLGLVADPDPKVRRQTPRALLACWEQAVAILPALQQRLAVESDPRARVALVEAVGALGVRAATGLAAGVDCGAVGSWLAGVAAREADPTVHLAALTQLVRCTPDRLPADIVSTVLGVIGQVYGDGAAAATAPAPAATASAEPTGPSNRRLPTPPATLIGALRQLRERDEAGRRAPMVGGLLHDLHLALGDRVPERIELLVALLRAPDWERRINAVRCAAALIQGWRGHYQELVARVGEQLADPEPRLCAAAAADALEDLDGLAAPAADALARCLDAAPRESGPAPESGLPPAWVTAWLRELPSTGPVLKALARLGDRRALPAVRWALERAQPPGDIGFVIASMGMAAAELVPLIRRRLRDLPVVDGYNRRRGGLVGALGGLGAAAAPAVPDLLALLRREEIDIGVVWALGRLGAAAISAAPTLRGLLDHADPETALAAASALWRITRDPTLCLPVFQRHLAQGGASIATAAQGVAELGATAAPAAERLRELLADAPVWVRLHAAEALWRAVGDIEATLPVLLALWDQNAHVRVHVACCVGEMGAAAGAAAPLLRRELGQVRRHNHDPHGYSSDAVRADEALLRACSKALTRITGAASADPTPTAN